MITKPLNNGYPGVAEQCVVAPTMNSIVLVKHNRIPAIVLFVITIDLSVKALVGEITI